MPRAWAPKEEDAHLLGLNSPQGSLGLPHEPLLGFLLGLRSLTRYAAGAMRQAPGQSGADAAGGVIALLQVAEADFSRNLAEAEAAEQEEADS